MSAVEAWLRRHLHDPPIEQQRVLMQKLRGFYQYFALWHATTKLRTVQREVQRLWFAALRQRGQKNKLTWDVWQRKP